MNRLWLAVSLAIFVLLSGCGGGNGGTSIAPPSNPPASVRLQTFADPWNQAVPRWRDIANTRYAPSFQSAFSYRNSAVTISYATAPNQRFFTGRVMAGGLKPNFAYQVKLAGKPVFASRGTGTAQSHVLATSRESGAQAVARDVLDAGGQKIPVNGDDWANQQLGYAGRWWDDTEPPSTNLNDEYFRANYPRHTLYGYLFMGVFVTDENGAANAEIVGNHALHITWQDEQQSGRDFDAGTFAVKPSSAYESSFLGKSFKLWYERENGRPSAVTLAPGTYHCRLLVTEEAFHGAGGSDGGVWKTVLASEEIGDTNPANDVVFTIPAGP